MKYWPHGIMTASNHEFKPWLNQVLTSNLDCIEPWRHWIWTASNRDGVQVQRHQTYLTASDIDAIHSRLDQSLTALNLDGIKPRTHKISAKQKNGDINPWRHQRKRQKKQMTASNPEGIINLDRIKHLRHQIFDDINHPPHQTLTASNLGLIRS